MAASTKSLARSTAHNVGLNELYQEALGRFDQSLAVKAANTRRNYLTGVRSLLAFLQDRWGGPDLESLTREHAQEWVRYLIDECGYAPATVHSHSVGARVFCKRLLANDVLTEDPFAKVEIPQAGMPPVEVLKQDDVQGMVNAARRDRSVWGRRDKAVMLLLYSGGFRQQELLNISDQDIDWKRGTISVMGKGSKPRELAPGSVAMEALDQYDQARKRRLRSLRRHRQERLGAKDAPIWISQRGGFWGKGGLGAMLKARAAQAGVTRPAHPHVWRHSAATHDADAGMTDLELRDKYGWAPNSSMPYRYTRATLRQRTIDRSQRIAAGNSIKI